MKLLQNEEIHELLFSTKQVKKVQEEIRSRKFAEVFNKGFMFILAAITSTIVIQSIWLVQDYSIYAKVITLVNMLVMLLLIGLSYRKSNNELKRIDAIPLTAENCEEQIDTLNQLLALEKGATIQPLGMAQRTTSKTAYKYEFREKEVLKKFMYLYQMVEQVPTLFDTTSKELQKEFVQKLAHNYRIELAKGNNVEKTEEEKFTLTAQYI